MLISVSKSRSGLEAMEDMLKARQKSATSLTKAINTTYENLGSATKVKQGLDQQLSEMRVLLNATKEDMDHLTRMIKTLRVQKINKGKVQANKDFRQSFKSQ